MAVTMARYHSIVVATSALRSVVRQKTFSHEELVEP